MGQTVKVSTEDIMKLQMAHSLVESLERVYKESLDLSKEQRAVIFSDLSDANLAFAAAKSEISAKYVPQDGKSYDWTADYNSSTMTFIEV